MIPTKEVLRLFRTPEWTTPEEIGAFVLDAERLAPSDLLKLLGMVLDKTLVTDGAGHRARCAAFQLLIEKHSGTVELFAPAVRALRAADPRAREVLVAVLPKVNNPAAHNELCTVLGCSDPQARTAAAEVLTLVAGRSALDLLTDMVADARFGGRTEAMDVLIPKAGHHVIPLLTNVLLFGLPSERTRALEYLTDTRLMAKALPTALEAVTRGLELKDERGLREVILALSKLAPEEEFFRLVSPRADAANLPLLKAIIAGCQQYRSQVAIDFLMDKFRAGPRTIRLAVLDALLEMRCDKAAGPLVEALTHKQALVRTRAAEVLSELALGGTIDLARTIVWLLRSRDTTVRRIAVELARKVGDPTGDLTISLLGFLRDEDWWVRERVMDALVEMAGPSLTRFMVAYLSDPSDVVRRYAIGALARLKDPAAIDALLLSATSDADWWAREQAVSALATIRDRRVVPHLVEILTHRPDLQLVCIQSLQSLTATEAAPHVAACLADPDGDLRLAAVSCLFALGARDWLAALKALDTDPDYRVRNAVRDGLRAWNVANGTAEGGEDRSMILLDRMLIAMAGAGGDDLLLAAERVPYMKRVGKMLPISKKPLSDEQLRAILEPHLSPAQLAALRSLADVDFSYEVHARNLRFRAHIFRQQTGISAVFRIVKNEILRIEALGLPPIVSTLGDLKNGMVILGGPTGSGKSTTLAALVDYINRTSSRHIVTIEDPIEVVHARKRSLINQREVGTHTATFKNALRGTLRQDPNVLLVGEMRDYETIAFAVSAAETGHLVFGTLHTASADTSVDRLINAFPSGQQDQVRSMLSVSLRAVVCQHLMRRANGDGRALAVEVMLNNDAIANLIRKGKCFQIPQVIATSREQGMQSMDSDLLRLVRAGAISTEDAYMKAIDKKAMESSLAVAAAAGQARAGDGARPGPGAPPQAAARPDSREPAGAPPGVANPSPAGRNPAGLRK
ncbi:MAG TPA: PilT/PilU family type 4a pilus ATPase [Thermoanaerobaculaceae bacterium]|nr:PilT/PilU family type 4a pilus ATPase [Thermoanaerobaculaceae bacterium]HPS79120.1 PilT/PilU family type 4a pilus ATPase [Thermoanaerobaculaceae bacterium]